MGGALPAFFIDKLRGLSQRPFQSRPLARLDQRSARRKSYPSLKSERKFGGEPLNAAAVRDAYSSYLQQFPWDAMFTVTFKSGRRDAINSSGQLGRFFLQNTLGREKIASRIFVATEPHFGDGVDHAGRAYYNASGRIHHHGLLFFNRPFVSGYERQIDEPLFDSREVSALLTDVFGYSRVSPIRNLQDVAGYCSKYVTKSGLESYTPGYDYQFLGDWHE